MDEKMTKNLAKSMDGTYTFYRRNREGELVAVGRFKVEDGNVSFPSEKDWSHLSSVIPEGPLTERMVHQMMMLRGMSAYSYIEKNS